MIKLFEQYNEYNKIKEWLDKYGIENYTINDDLTVDVDGNVDLFQKNLDNIPIQFGRVNGPFNVRANNLKTLKGCPNIVYGGFYCHYNELTDLKGGPTHTASDYICSYNSLTSLEGSPKNIRGSFYCKNNELKSLKNAPVSIDNDFTFYNNPLPEEIERLMGRAGKTLLKYQEEYGIWREDGSFNDARYKIFQRDYMSGILD